MTDDDKPRPDWTLWHYMPAARLWEAVALSLNIDPKFARGLMGSHPDYPKPVHPDFLRRLRLAEVHVAIGKTLQRIDVQNDQLARPGHQEDTPVSLLDFSRLAQEMEWMLPAEFPRADPEPAAVAQTSPGKGHSLRSRRTLLTIIAALAEKAKIDVNARGAAQQIKKLTDNLGVSLSETAIRDILADIPDALEHRIK